MCCGFGNTYHSPYVSVAVGTMLTGRIVGSQCDTQPGTCATWQVFFDGINSVLTWQNSFSKMFTAVYGGVFEWFGGTVPAHGVSFTNIQAADFYAGSLRTVYWNTYYGPGTPGCGVTQSLGLSTIVQSWPCYGCIDANGVCQPGGASRACGLNGVACEDCIAEYGGEYYCAPLDHVCRCKSSPCP